MKNRKNITMGLVISAIATVLLMSSAFANTITRSIEVSYRNIRIFMDGEELIARDGAGNRVEPFVYEGTTYLPVRAISEAFGRDVVWDADNSFIHLNTPGSVAQQPTTPTATPVPTPATPPAPVSQGVPLTTLGLLVREESNVNAIMSSSNPPNYNILGYDLTRDGVNYPNSLRYQSSSGLLGSEGHHLTFALNGAYTLLTGYVGSESGFHLGHTNVGEVRFLGDGVLLATYTFTESDNLQPISVDVTDVQNLVIIGRYISGGAFFTVVASPHIQ